MPPRARSQILAPAAEPAGREHAGDQAKRCAPRAVRLRSRRSGYGVVGPGGATLKPLMMMSVAEAVATTSSRDVVTASVTR